MQNLASNISNLTKIRRQQQLSKLDVSAVTNNDASFLSQIETCKKNADKDKCAVIGVADLSEFEKIQKLG